MTARRPLHRLEGAAFLVLALIAFTLAHQQGFHILAWGFTGLLLILIWLAAGLCMGWMGRPSLNGSTWVAWAFAALISGLRHVPFFTASMQAQWEGPVGAQMFWGTAFICVGCAFARGLKRPVLPVLDRVENKA